MQQEMIHICPESLALPPSRLKPKENDAKWMSAIARMRQEEAHRPAYFIETKSLMEPFLCAAVMVWYTVY